MTDMGIRQRRQRGIAKRLLDRRVVVAEEPPVSGVRSRPRLGAFPAIPRNG